jgi:predicted PhzF superfamily epimerase YddE/YHI9
MNVYQNFLTVEMRDQLRQAIAKEGGFTESSFSQKISGHISYNVSYITPKHFQ